MWPFRSKGKPKAAKTLGPSDFGPFSTLFGPDALYLSLLHMMRDKSDEACKIISELVASNEETYHYVRQMLADVNWRPHLVACVAALTSHQRSEYVGPLWEAFDAGSWVAPQLAVALSFCDPDFEESAKQRISDCCPVSPPTDLSVVDRHSAAGPAGTVARSGKNIASLLELLSIMKVDPDWLSEVSGRSEIEAVLGEDFDNSAQFTRSWMNSIRTSLEPLGVGLEH